MEKHIQKLIFIILLAINYNISSQVPDFTERIHIPLWAEIDAYPELKEIEEFGDGNYDFAIQRMRKVAPFILNGMIYGWEFSYCPSDKLRNIEEYLEITNINKISETDGTIHYAKPWIQDNLLNCWVEYTRTPQMMWNLKMWKSITIDKTHGRGTGKISSGFEGIEDATKNCIKDAIRSYYREILKNKPKEINGKLIIKNEPKIGLKSGQYIVELDFFLETDKIIKYTQF